MKVLLLIGSRREAIAIAPILRQMRAHSSNLEPRVCCSGESEDAAGVAAELGAPPDLGMAAPLARGSPSALTADLLSRIDTLLAAEEPDWLLVYGHSATALAGSLAAYYRNVRLAHVEAGLRTHARYVPFPDEAHRRLADVLADLHFAPTPHAARCLEQEGVDAAGILVTGSTGIDALEQALAVEPAADEHPVVEPAGDRRLLLATLQHPVRFEGPLRELCHALRQLAGDYGSGLRCVLPLALGPDLHEPVAEVLGGLDNVELVPILPYVRFVRLLARSDLVLTESGSVHEQACHLGRPVLLLRNVTERLESLAEGNTRLVGTQCADIVKETHAVLDDATLCTEMSRPLRVYGDGRASERICYELQRCDEEIRSRA